MDSTCLSHLVLDGNSVIHRYHCYGLVVVLGLPQNPPFMPCDHMFLSVTVIRTTPGRERKVS